jgi:hypothetical protein
VDVEELHYPLGAVAYTRGANRFQMNYGRQRAGIFCVGGVCRQVPAASGFSFSVSSTFWAMKDHTRSSLHYSPACY